MQKKKILVVDDELDMRIFISTLLETSGYQPVMTSDGKEGLRKARMVSPERPTTCSRIYRLSCYPPWPKKHFPII